MISLYLIIKEEEVGYMISFILPTLGNRENEIKRLFNSFDGQTDKDFEVIVVSQDNHELIDEIIKRYDFKIIHIKTNKKGLSKSRNIAMDYVSGDIITFSDDDCWYDVNTVSYVSKYVQDNDIQIVTFQHIDKEKNEYPKKYPKNHIKNLSKRLILKQASIDIFINTKNVKNYNILFDERFGLGAKYNSGEENIYLMDLKNLGYKIDYEPTIISYHPNKRKKGDTLNKEMIIGKGPLFKRLYGDKLGKIMYTAFMIKKINKIDNFLEVYREGLKNQDEFIL